MEKRTTLRRTGGQWGEKEDEEILGKGMRTVGEGRERMKGNSDEDSKASGKRVGKLKPSHSPKMCKINFLIVAAKSIGTRTKRNIWQSVDRFG